MDNKFTTKVKHIGSGYAATFSVGAQTFTVYKGTNEGIALWYERMLIFALDKLTNNDTTTKQSPTGGEESGQNAE